MNDFEQLVQLLRKFPGVGTRQARRFAYFLVQSNPIYVRELTDAIASNKRSMRLCPVSFQYFYADDPKVETSPIVRDPRRDPSTLLIVAKDMDVEAIEATHSYQGWYFVLGGLLSVVPSRSPAHLRIDELRDHLSERQSEIREIIFGLPVNADGEHTREHLHSLLSPIAEAADVAISTLGRGLSTGTELEYVDEATFQNAFQNRA